MGKDCRYLVIYLILPNFLFFAISPFVYFVRPIFVLDYLVVGLFSQILSRRNIVVLVGSLFIVDVSFSVAPSYHLQGLDFAENAYAVFLMSWPEVLRAFFYLLVVLFIYFYFFSKYFSSSSRITPRNVAMIFTSVFLLFVIDVINGSNIYFPSKFNLISQNIAGGNLHKLLHLRINAFGGTASQTTSRATDVSAATASLRNILTSEALPPADKILLVVVESYGVPVSEKLQRLFAEPFSRDSLKLRYDIRQGELAVSGSTVSGEIRELCGQRISSPSDVAHISMTDCLPNLLKLQSYNTTSVHGFSRYMFDRQSWYPRLGFESMLFADEIVAAGYLNRCGHVFRGSCDADVAKLVQNLLSPVASQENANVNNRQFVYWLTLNSHLPVARDTSLERGMDCSLLLDSGDGEQHEEACRLSRVLLGTLYSIVDIAKNTNGSLHVIIVGDHAPPFVWQKDRSLFKSGVVPFVELISKFPNNLYAPKR